MRCACFGFTETKRANLKFLPEDFGRTKALTLIRVAFLPKNYQELFNILMEGHSRSVNR